MKDNIIDFTAIRDALQKRGYPGWMCLEYVWVDWEGCNRTDNVSETILLRDLLRAPPRPAVANNLSDLCRHPQHNPIGKIKPP